MKNPTYATLVEDASKRAAYASGQVRALIREGHRDYRSGSSMMLCSHLDPWTLLVTLSEVRHTVLGALGQEDIRDLGYESVDQVLHELRSFHPEIDLESPATILKWDDVRGKMAQLPETGPSSTEVFHEGVRIVPRSGIRAKAYATVAYAKTRDQTCPPVVKPGTVYQIEFIHQDNIAEALLISEDSSSEYLAYIIVNLSEWDIAA